MIVINNELIFNNEYEEYSYSSTYFNIYYHKSKWFESVYKKVVEMVGDSYEKEVRCFVTNTARALKVKCRCLRVPRRKCMYTNNPQKISYKKMIELVDTLVDKGCVKLFKGKLIKHSNGNLKSEPTLTVFTDKYLELWLDVNMSGVSYIDKDISLVCIRDRKDKTDLPTRGVSGVGDLRKMVDKYNRSLVDCEVSVADTNTPLLSYRKVYNDDLTKGGRWYEMTNSVQNMKSNLRKSILIDGCPTVELDFSSLHASIAYEKLGVKLSNDFKPYDIPEKSLIRLDSNKVDIVQSKLGSDVVYNPVRNLCKLALLCAFNCTDMQQAQRAIVSKVVNEKESVNKGEKKIEDCKYYGIIGFDSKLFCAGILNHNHLIDQFIFSDMGVWFQNIDSKIADYVIEKFLWKGEVVLSWHDSFLTKEHNEGFLRETMEEAYENVLGSKMNCKIEKK